MLVWVLIFNSALNTCSELHEVIIYNLFHIFKGAIYCCKCVSYYHTFLMNLRVLDLQVPSSFPILLWQSKTMWSPYVIDIELVLHIILFYFIYVGYFTCSYKGYTDVRIRSPENGVMVGSQHISAENKTVPMEEQLTLLNPVN